MNNIGVLGGFLALALTIGACANDTGSEAQDVDAAAATEEILSSQPEAGAGSPSAAAGALRGTSAAGDILVGPDGMSLYGFTNDVDAASTCYGTCADAWPPVLVDENWTVGPELDTGIFATTVRDDGELQLVAGKWPLYYYAGDGAPGDINGQGSGDVWFLVDPDGALITDAAPTGEASGDEAPADEAPEGEAGGGSGPATVDTGLGQVLADEQGLTLYGFLEDSGAVPSCYDDCADAWPPYLVDGPDLPGDLDPAVYSVVERDDGTFQLVAGIWPLYRFTGDGGPGDTNGQGSGDVWFAAAADGTLIGAPGTGGGESSGSDDSSEEEDGGGPYDY